MFFVCIKENNTGIYNIIKPTAITIIIIGAYITILKEVKNIEKCKYIFHTITIYYLTPFLMILFLGGIESISGSNDIFFSYMIFSVLNTIYTCIYLSDKNKRKRNQCFYFTLCASILFLLSPLFYLSRDNSLIRSSAISLGITDGKNQLYFIERLFIEKNVGTINEFSKRELDGYIAYCGKKYWETEKTIVFKKHDLQESYINIPIEKIRKYQGRSYTCIPTYIEKVIITTNNINEYLKNFQGSTK